MSGFGDDLAADIPKQLAIQEEDDAEDIDETLSERLWGLTEMFPERMRSVCGTTAELSFVLAKAGYGFCRQALWQVTTTATILLLPPFIMVMNEQYQEEERKQQAQALFGPNAAVAGANPQHMLPPGMRPASG